MGGVSLLNRDGFILNKKDFLWSIARKPQETPDLFYG